MILYYIFDEQLKELTIDVFNFRLTENAQYIKLQEWNKQFQTSHCHQDQVSSTLLNNFEFNILTDFSK